MDQELAPWLQYLALNARSLPLVCPVAHWTAFQIHPSGVGRYGQLSSPPDRARIFRLLKPSVATTLRAENTLVSYPALIAPSHYFHLNKDFAVLPITPTPTSDWVA